MIGRDRRKERTGFQESRPYNPKIDLQTDFVMAYGIGEDMPERIKVWKEKGYVVHLMTGVAWGQYQDYLYGRIDGRNHWDEAQTYSNNEHILHGKDVPYMVPTISYTEFLTERIRIAVDAGVEAIHLEEPEFWVEGGYSEAFKREWEIFYKEPWKAPKESVDGQYRASKLKAYLYTRCLDRLCGTLKEYAKVKYNRDLRFYVPTHSLINYTQWRIVSPESRLLDLPTVDGYIAQIWTGTSRTPNVYEGVRKERTFETAFLEYGIMQELVRGTGRDMWFLHDPIEDNPNYTWKNYKENYFEIVTASLLHPYVSNYEICPWPNRVFNGTYPAENGNGKESIPKEYATILLNLMHTLGNMEQEDVYWEGKNSEIGVLLADSSMFQRNYPEWNTNQRFVKYDGTSKISLDEFNVAELINWSSFYGLALPMLKQGIPVRPVQLDNVRRFSGYLDDYKVLVLSYEFMKPEYPDLHNAVAQWVKNGGALIYVGDGSDEFHKVREWWNQGKCNYNTPAEHLFESLGLDAKLEAGIYSVGKGVFAYMDVHPIKCAANAANAEKLRETIRQAAALLKDDSIQMDPHNYFILHRGPYVIASVLDESVEDKPFEFNGSFVNLFEADLPVINKLVVNPGSQALLYDLSKAKEGIELIAASSRMEYLKENSNGFEILAKGPEAVEAYARFKCDKKAVGVSAKEAISGKEIEVGFVWNEESSTVLLSYSNLPDGVLIDVKFED
jgi:hypothetical protein